MKQAVAWIFMIVTWACAPAVAAEGVPAAKDLSRDGALAREMKGVVLVLFSADYCRYCKTVLHDYLEPMSRLSEYQGKVVMRKVEISSYETMTDFKGNKTPQRHFAGDSGVRMVPTVAVFDGQGRMLGKPVVGLSIPDYYAQYLDDAIQLGLEKVRGKPAVKQP